MKNLDKQESLYFLNEKFKLEEESLIDKLITELTKQLTKPLKKQLTKPLNKLN